MERDPSPSAPLLSPSTVGDVNRSRVLQALWDHGPQSRADLARLAGVTRGTIGNIVQTLVDSGLLEEGPPRTGHVGKPALPLWFSERSALTVAAMLDSTSVQAALVNGRGDVLARTTEALRGATADQDEIATALLAALSRIIAEADGEAQAVGIAVPGPYDPVAREVLGSGPIPGLVGDWMPRRIEDETGLRVVVDNDSRVQALGEKWFGDGRGRRTFATIQTGYGIGVGVVIDGRVYRGANSHAGEFGHVCVVVDGELCVCGLQGCWETIATLRWLEREVASRGLRVPAATAAALVEAAEGGDEDAAKLLDAYARNLAVGIANLHLVFAPETVILHGDAALGGERFRALVEQHTRARVFTPDALNVSVRLSSLGEEAGLVGAAALVLSETYLLTA